jgi:hypothetical protein
MHWTARRIEDATRRAFDRFLDLYEQFGQHRFHGSADFHDPHTYRGPMFWSEADCVYRLALELEKEFANHVHLGFELSASTLYPFVARDKGEVDLAVSDLSDFEANDTSHQRFGSRKHELFVEAKYLPKGHWPRDVKRKIEQDIPKNVVSQVARLRSGRCVCAACLIVDDEDHVFHALHSGNLSVPPDILLLHASPATLALRERAALA